MPYTIYDFLDIALITLTKILRYRPTGSEIKGVHSEDRIDSKGRKG